MKARARVWDEENEGASEPRVSFLYGIAIYQLQIL